MSSIHHDTTELYFRKTFLDKSPWIKYKSRMLLDQCGISQPVEYQSPKDRCAFEALSLSLWKKYGFAVPVVIDIHPPEIIVEYIKGKTLQEALVSENTSEVLTALFKEVNERHKVALSLNEPKLCHLDANMRNIIYHDGEIYHIDFEMGRLWEPVEKWAMREISKMLITLLEILPKKEYIKTIELFKQYYQQDIVLQTLKSSVLDRPFQNFHRMRNAAKKRNNPKKVTLYDLLDQL